MPLYRRSCLIRTVPSFLCFVFFFNDTATTEIYTLSLHDALPIYPRARYRVQIHDRVLAVAVEIEHRSEEHTSELQSRGHLVCRLLLDKKKDRKITKESPQLKIRHNSCHNQHS